MLYDIPLRFIFYLKKDIDINNLILQKDEVVCVKYMSIDEISQLIKNNEVLHSHAVQFKHMLEIRDNK